MMGWALLAGAVMLALAKSPWWWLAVVPLAVWRALQWHTYSSRPWRRVHYPAMRAYARAAGLESGTAERDGRAFDISRALENLLMELEGRSREDASRHVLADLSTGLGDADAAWIDSALASAKPDPRFETITTLALREHYARDDNAVRVRLGIAGIIGRRLTQEDRAEYLLEAAKGNAP